MISLLLTALIAAAPPPAEVRIEARDFSITMPAQISAGLTAFTLENRGAEPHDVRFVRIAGTHTIDDFAAWQKSGKAIPDWLVPSGGIGTVAPGLHQEYIMALDAGAYVALCSYPSQDGTPHSEKGMFAPLTVDAGGAAAARPEADVTVTLTDHHFQLTAPMEGPHPLVHLRNTGTEPHQAQIVKLPEAGMEYAERAWFDHGGHGPRPGQPIGGSIEVPVGGEAWFRAELPPGHYLLLCAQAEEEGRHYELGMVYRFEIE
jgi:hypothetical protein